MLRHLPAALTAGRYPRPPQLVLRTGTGHPNTGSALELDCWRQLGWTPL